MTIRQSFKNKRRFRKPAFNCKDFIQEIRHETRLASKQVKKDSVFLTEKTRKVIRITCHSCWHYLTLPKIYFPYASVLCLVYCVWLFFFVRSFFPEPVIPANPPEPGSLDYNLSTMRLPKADDSIEKLVTKQETYTLQTATTSAVDKVISFETRGNVGIAFTPLANRFLGEPNIASASAKNGKTVYEDIYNGIDLIYTPSADRLLEEYEIKVRRSFGEFVQKLDIDTSKVGYETLKDNSLRFFDKATNQTVFSLPKPVMYEKYNHANRSYGLHYEVKVVNGVTFLIKVLDKGGRRWLDTTHYPVMVDGTVVTSSLNLESYPVSLGKWSVRLDTVGTDTLTLSTSNSPSPSSEEGNTSSLLKGGQESYPVFESLTCGADKITVTQSNNLVSVPNFSCSEAAVVTYTLTSAGTYTLSATFGSDTKEVTTTYNPQQSTPTFTWVNQTPLNVTPGQTITVSTHITDPNGITIVKASLDRTLPTIDLNLKEGTAIDGTWEGTWVAENTHPISYFTTITATNSLGISATSESIEWTDWNCTDGGDHLGADFTPATECPTGFASAVSPHSNIATFSVGVGTTAYITSYSAPLYGTVDIRATTVNIQGVLSANGRGYNGGTTAAPNGLGPGGGTGGGYGAGAGHGGTGGAGSAAGSGPYDVSVSPTDMGSGGGGRSGVCSGGNGGGAIKLTASGTTTVAGVITVNGSVGGASYCGGGAGGSIYIITDQFSGSGILNANGGNSATANAGGGAGGRVSIKYASGSLPSPTITVSPGANGSPESGTIAIIDTTNNDLYIRYTQVWRAQGTMDGATHTYRTVNVQNNIVWTLKGYNTNNTDGVGFTFNVADFNLDVGSTINLNSMGYPGGNTTVTTGVGPGGGTGTGSSYGGGGGYGGTGATSTSPAAGGNPYGILTAPTELGSGGGGRTGTSNGGNGGGAIIINASGTATIGGIITANGGVGGTYGGGGSGGSVYINTYTYSGSGAIYANGGNGGGANDGGGGGGKIAIKYASGSTPTPPLSATVGTGGSGGENGTTVIIDTRTNDVYLRTSQTWRANPAYEGSTQTFSDFTITNNSTLTVKSYYTSNYDGVGMTFNVIDFTLDTGSSVNLNGLGYTGGTSSASDGLGPGGGKGSSSYGGGAGYGGTGGTSTLPGAGGTTYGSASEPVNLGSGGGGRDAVTNGGNGGGAIKIQSSGTTTISGTISANGNTGGSSYGGGGSGGSIYIVTPNFTGTGALSATGGNAGGANCGNGGGGRIRIQLTSGSAPSYTGTMLVTAGNGGQGGGIGTVNYDFLRYFDHQGADWTIASSTVLSGVHVNIGTFTVNPGVLITPLANNTNTDTSLNLGKLEIQASNIDIGGTINADGLGYAGGTGGSNGLGTGGGEASGDYAGGGGYGGKGAQGVPVNNSGNYPGAGGSAYGSMTAPTEIGSGGGSRAAGGTGGTGGGAVILTASNSITMSGRITANGTAGSGTYGGGGSGGSIYLNAPSISGSGTLIANGGAGASASAGGGGGGRIAVIYTTGSAPTLNVTSVAGTGGLYNEGGTAPILNITTNDLYIRGNQMWNAAPTQEGSAQTYHNITVTNNAVWQMHGYYTTNTDDVGLSFNVTNFTIDVGSSVSANALGFHANGYNAFGDGPGGGTYSYSIICGGISRGGGGYGGHGASATLGGGTYGSQYAPVNLGSAGWNGCAPSGAVHGGGAIKIYASDTLTVNGSITANGGYGANAGGGSGGSIYLIAKNLVASGPLSANGADGSGAIAYAGGGGRIAYYYNTKSGDFSSVTANMGTVNNAGAANGTIHQGMLYIWDGGGGDNNWSTGANWTGDTTPGATDIAWFNDTSTKDATVDSSFGGTLISLVIEDTYTGTITQARNLTITTDYNQVGGTFTGSSYKLTVSGDFIQSGGTYNQGTAGSDTLTTGLTGYWNMDEASGTTTVADTSGNGKNGVSSSSTNVTTGKFNNARSFDGTQYVSVASPGLPTGDFTYSTWVNLSANSDEMILMAANGSGGNEMYLYINGGYVAVALHNAAVFTGTTTIPTGQWVNLILTRSGSTVKLYVNGTEDGSGSNGTALTFSTCSLYIGVDIDSGCSATLGNYANGNIDDVRIYSRAISQREISDIANANLTSDGVTLDAASNLTISGGTFNDSTKDVSVGKNFTVSGGTINADQGSFTFTGTTASTLSCNNTSFNNVNLWNANTLTINSNCSFPLSSNPTVLGPIVTSGPLSGTNTLRTNSTITYNTGSSISGFSSYIASGAVTVTGATLDMGAYTSFSDASTLTVSSGTITLPSTGTTTITSNFSQSDGTVTAGSGTVDINGSLTQTGGSFTAPSSTLSIVGSFTVTPPATFTHNNGTIALDGLYAGNTNIDAPGASLNLVTISRNGDLGGINPIVTITPNTTVPLGNTPTVTLNNTNNAQSYSLTNNGMITVGTGTATFNIDGTLTNTGTINGSNTSWVMNGSLTNSGTVIMASANSFDYSIYDYGYGHFTNSSGAVFTTSANPTFNVSGSFIVAGDSTFPSSGVTLTMDGAYVNNTSIDAPGVTFTLVTMNRSVNSGSNIGLTIAAGTTVPFGDTPSVTLVNVNSNQLYSLTNNGTITVGTGPFNVNIGGNFTNNGTITSTGSTLDFNSTGATDITFTNSPGAVFTTPAPLTFNLQGNYFVDPASTFPRDNMTVVLDGGWNQTYTGNISNLAVLRIDKSAGTLTINTDVTTATFTRADGVVGNSAVNSILNVTGDASFTTSDAFGGNGLAVKFTGNNNQNITNTNSAAFNSPFIVDKSGGAAKLTTPFTVTGQRCLVNEGTLDLNGQAFVCATNFVVENGGILQIEGSEYVTAPTLRPYSTVSYKGDGDSAADTYVTRSWNYQNLTTNFTDSTDTLMSGNDSTATNLQGFWKMDEGSGSSVANSSAGVGNTAVLKGNAAFTTSVPILTDANPYAITFDGADDYLDIGDSVSIIRNKATVSVSAWVYPKAYTGTPTVIWLTTGTSTTNGRFVINFSTGGAPQCGARAGDAESGQTVVSTSTYTANNWYHIVCSVDYASDTIDMYVNGIKQTTTGTVNFTATATSDTVSLRTSIGLSPDRTNNDFNGYIDQIRLYDRILTPSEVQYLYSGEGANLSINGNLAVNSGTFKAPATTTLSLAGNLSVGGTFNPNNGTVSFVKPTYTVAALPSSNLVGHWKLNETSGTAVADNSGVGNTGVANGTVIIDGINGKARSFNNTTNDSVVAGAASMPTGGSARTISAWIKPTGNGGTIVAENTASGQKFILEDAFDGTNWYLFTDGINAGNNITLGGSEIPPLGAWSHIVFTLDGSNNWKYYLNGIFIKGGTYGTSINTAAPTSITLGKRLDYAGQYFNGGIDEVRIFTRAVTGDEVFALYHEFDQYQPFSSYASIVSGTQSPAVTFNNLSITEANKMVKFTSGQTFRINGTLSLNGTNEAGRVQLYPTVNGSQWFINYQGSLPTSGITYAFVADGGCDGSSKTMTIGTATATNGNVGTCCGGNTTLNITNPGVYINGTTEINGNTMFGY